MDTEDKIGYSILGVIVSILLWGLISAIYAGVYLDPIRNDIAQISCVESGFETYIYFTTTIYSTELKALFCGTYEERMIREGHIDAYQNTGDEKGTFVVKNSV